MRFFIAPLVLALILAGCAAPAPTSDGTGADGGQWALTDSTGEEWSPAELEGKPAVLFFMATWCPTCKSLAPTLTKVHADHADDVQFLTIGFDPSETDEDMEAWKSQYAQPWPHGVDPTGKAARNYGVTVQSWIVVLDKDGGVVLNKYKPSESDIRTALDAAAGA